MSARPTISVIIPTYYEAGTIRDAVGQFERLAGRWEIIVADSGSEDGTAGIARSLDGVTVVEAPRGRGAGMNAGAALATGEILLFLHADTKLPEGAYRLIVERLADPKVAATAFKLRMDRDEFRFRILSQVSNLRFALQRTFFGDQAIAVRRADFERIGGYHEPLLMEDVDLSLRLRRTGRLRVLPAEVVTSARRFEQGGVLRTLLRMSIFQGAYMRGVPADTLARRYRHVREEADMSDGRPRAVRLADLAFVDEEGHEVRPADWRGQPTLLVFLRWLG